MKTIIRALVCSAAVSNGVSFAAAQEMLPAPAETKNDVVVLGKRPPESQSDDDRSKYLLDRYLPYEQRVAGWVENTARSIDRFFGTDDAWRVDNDSYLRITNDIRWEQSEGLDHDLRPRLKLDLPTASKRLRLLIESDAPQENTAAEETVPGLMTGEDRRRTTVLGLGTNFEGWLPQWKKRFQGGVRFALPIDPYVRFTARRDLPLGGQWELGSYNRLAWFDSDGYSARSELKVGKPLAPDWRLYYSTKLSWREKRDYLEFSQSVNFANILSSREAVTYALGLPAAVLKTPKSTNIF